MSDTEPNARQNAQALAILETIEVVTRILRKVRVEVKRHHNASAYGHLVDAKEEIETAMKALLKV